MRWTLSDLLADFCGLLGEHFKMPAAAMQFVLAHPAIASFVAGMRTVAQLVQNVNWLGHPIPAAFWSDLKAKGLLREDAPTPVQ
jgi:D-threo-aldose 1-dehydrogenase